MPGSVTRITAPAEASAILKKREMLKMKVASLLVCFLGAAILLATDLPGLSASTPVICLNLLGGGLLAMSGGTWALIDFDENSKASKGLAVLAFAMLVVGAYAVLGAGIVLAITVFAVRTGLTLAACILVIIWFGRLP